MDAQPAKSIDASRFSRLRSTVDRATGLLACLFLWIAMLLAAQALREAFAFVPGFVPWNGESPSSFLACVASAATLAVLAIVLMVTAGSASPRALAGRVVAGAGLRLPASRREMGRWAAVGLVAALALWAAAELVVNVPGLTAVPPGEDPRHIALAQMSTTGRVCYGLIAPAPLEELLFRGPLLALWLALIAARRRDRWVARRRVQWWLMTTAVGISLAVFAAGHTVGGTVNVVHAAVNAAIATGITLWQRSLFPAMAAHGLYDAWAFA
ncbi:CPBP family intramembrane glutamic endopeptidase [Streptomyces parvulus]|uniref:CPBP family intramembrane glutamic endopeptidase n=1 Tax=Streptomyces parvulus TaxID=146923 RepID=UPI0033A6C15E